LTNIPGNRENIMRDPARHYGAGSHPAASDGVVQAGARKSDVQRKRDE